MPPALDGISSTQGLSMWAAVRAPWVLQCAVVFRVEQHTLQEFVQRWVTLLCVTATESSLYRNGGRYVHDSFIIFVQGRAMFLARWAWKNNGRIQRGGGEPSRTLRLPRAKTSHLVRR